MHFILWRDKGCLLVPESKEGRKENNGNMQESSYLLLMPEADFPVITRSQLEPEYSSEHLEDQRANWVGTKTWKLWVQKNPGVGLFIMSRWFVTIFFFFLIPGTTLKHEFGWLQDHFFAGRAVSVTNLKIKFSLIFLYNFKFRVYKSKGPLNVQWIFFEIRL